MFFGTWGTRIERCEMIRIRVPQVETTWDTRSGKGYDAKAAEWRAKLPAKQELSPTNDPAAGGTQGTGSD